MTFTPTNNPTFVRQPNRQGCQLTSTAGGIVYTAGANGSKITGLFANSSDPVPQTLVVNLNASGPIMRVITTIIPGYSGTVPSLPSLDLLSLVPGLPRDRNGNHYLTLAIGDVLAAQVSAITQGAAINLFAIGGDY